MTQSLRSTTNHHKYKTSMLVYKSGSGKTPQLVYTTIHKFLYISLFLREKRSWQFLCSIEKGEIRVVVRQLTIWGSHRFSMSVTDHTSQWPLKPVFKWNLGWYEPLPVLKIIFRLVWFGIQHVVNACKHASHWMLLCVVLCLSMHRCFWSCNGIVVSAKSGFACHWWVGSSTHRRRPLSNWISNALNPYLWWSIALTWERGFSRGYYCFI